MADVMQEAFKRYRGPKIEVHQPHNWHKSKYYIVRWWGLNLTELPDERAMLKHGITMGDGVVFIPELKNFLETKNRECLKKVHPNYVRLSGPSIYSPKESQMGKFKRIVNKIIKQKNDYH